VRAGLRRSRRLVLDFSGFFAGIFCAIQVGGLTRLDFTQ